MRNNSRLPLILKHMKLCELWFINTMDYLNSRTWVRCGSFTRDVVKPVKRAKKSYHGLNHELKRVWFMLDRVPLRYIDAINEDIARICDAIDHQISYFGSAPDDAVKLYNALVHEWEFARRLMPNGPPMKRDDVFLAHIRRL